MLLIRLKFRPKKLNIFGLQLTDCLVGFNRIDCNSAKYLNLFVKSVINYNGPLLMNIRKFWLLWTCLVRPAKNCSKLELPIINKRSPRRNFSLRESPSKALIYFLKSKSEKFN